ncbi:MAG: hypothetical protein ACYCZX_02595 [Rhodospirillaceae bacterium]
MFGPAPIALVALAVLVFAASRFPLVDALLKSVQAGLPEPSSVLLFSVMLFFGRFAQWAKGGCLASGASRRF